MSTLYELTNEYLELLEMASDPDVDEQAFADTLEGLGGEIEIKAEGYAKVIKMLEADVKALDEEIKRMSERKASTKSRIEAMKKSLESAMIATDKRKFKTLFFSFGIQKNPPAVVLDSEDIPEEFLIPQPPKVDKTEIKNRLKSGEKFAFAHLEQTEGLRIR